MAATKRTAGWIRSAAWLAAATVSVAGVVLLLMVLAGWFHPKVPSGPPARAADENLLKRPQAEVRVIQRPRYETAVGTIKPVHEAAVAAKILARVVQLDVKAGQAVTEGEVLVRLDDKELQARQQQAEAAVAASEARTRQADADFKRAEGLVAQNVVSRAEYDQALATKQAAASELEGARHALEEARVMLDHATIRAPLTGVIVDKRVEEGDTVTPGQTLLTLYDPTRMQLVASVRESLALRLKVGQKLPAQLESLNYQCQATVSEVVPEAQSASRSFSVKVTGPCPPGVYSGMFGRIFLPLDDEQLVVIPSAAVRQVGQLTMVDVVDGQAVQRRHVQLGRTFDEDVEVLSGLKAGEKVILGKRPKSMAG